MTRELQKTAPAERSWPSVLGSVGYWWAFCLCCAAILTWTYRHSINQDGLSYLDMASEASKHGLNELVNGYWSPAYPGAIALALLVFRPTAAQEWPLVHLVNLCIFVFALFTFSFFYHYWSEMTYARDGVDDKNKGGYIAPFAFCTFLWFTLEFIGLELVTPDLAVAAIVFLAAGIVCRLSLRESNRRHYVVLGAALGIGYCFKSVMFPLSLIFLTILFLLVPAKVTRGKLVWSLAAFLLTSSPLLIALSLRVHKLSFGESGRLNYLWYVDGFSWAGGTDNQEWNQTAEHPAPKLLQTPVTLDFRSLGKGTYPLWYDPSFWYAGSTVRLDLAGQTRMLRSNLSTYRDIVSDTIVFIAGGLLLCALLLREKRRITIQWSGWWQVAWPLAAFSLYAFVHVERRFLGAFLVLLWLGIYGALTSRLSRETAAIVCATVLLTVMLPFTVQIVRTMVHIPSDVAHPETVTVEEIGRSLRDLGLQGGDRLAVVGYAYSCYYARYDRLQIAAQIPDSRGFWQLSAAESESMEKRLASIGVKAIVAPNRPETSASSGWKDVWRSGSSRLSVLLLTSRS